MPEANVNRIWVLEVVAYEICLAFVDSNEKTCSCIHRLGSVWRNLVDLLQEGQLWMLENWAIVSWLICFSYDYRCKDALIRLLELVNIQVRKLKIDSNTSSTVVRSLHTMITLYYYEERNITEALKYIESNTVLYKEQLLNLLKNDAKSLFPEELRLQNLQRNLVPYVAAVMKYMGAPKIHKVISNFENAKDEILRDKSDLSLSSLEIPHKKDSSNEYDMVIPKGISEVKICLPKVTPCLTDDCKLIETDNGVQTISLSHVSCLSGVSSEGKYTEIDSNVEKSNSSYIGDDSRLGDPVKITDSYNGMSSKPNLRTCRRREYEMQYNSNRKYFARSKYQGNSHVANPHEASLFNEAFIQKIDNFDTRNCKVLMQKVTKAKIVGQDSISSLANADENLAHAYSSETFKINIPELEVKQCKGRYNLRKRNSEILKNHSATIDSLRTAFQKSSFHNKRATDSTKVSSPTNRSATEIELSSPRERSDLVLDTDVETLVTNRTQLQKSRVKFTEKEEKYIIEGIKKYGKGEWRKILDRYPFHKSRTNISIKDKYRTMLRAGVLQ